MIEHRLLELAYTTDAKITPSVLAFFAPCSIEDAEKVLDNLAARDRVTMEIEDDGTIVYHVPDRQKLEPPRRPPLRPAQALDVIRPPPLVPIARSPTKPASPALAALLSTLIPGAGQLYVGRWLAGALWFLVVSAGYALLLPGLILHLFCIVSAAGSAHQLNSTMARLQLHEG